MEYRRLGRSGLMVSELCLGCMTFGRELDEPGAVKLVDRFIEAGGNFLDTADVYSAGASEEITGRAIKGIRDDIVLATKVRFPTGDGSNDAGLSRKHIMQACEASLSRLGTDYIDLYQVHCWDELTPIEETLSALTDLVRAGRVRYIGISNFTGWQIAKAMLTSEARFLESFISVQPQYSLVERNIEHEVVPASLEHGLGLLPWGPLGGGFLSGKYKPYEKPPPDARISNATPDLEEAWDKRATERNWSVLEVLGDVSDETGKSYAQIALNWLLWMPGVVAPILGARVMEQLEDNLGAAGWRLDEEHHDRLTEASAPFETYPYGFITKMKRG